MVKKLALGSLGFLLLASPVLVSAQTTISVQARIDALLKQIAQLQAQVAALRGQPNTSTPTTGAASRCLDLRNDLWLGRTDAATNGEVSRLQEFLVGYGMLNASAKTGYYGPLTARAVYKYQTETLKWDWATLSSGVGPKTRAELRRTCGSDSTPNSQNKPPVISSFSGPTTLAVREPGTWNIVVTDPDNDKMRYMVRWGDEPSPGDVAHPFNWISLGLATEYFSPTFIHVYRQAGTYTPEVYVVDDKDVNHVTSRTVTVQVVQY